MYETKVRTYEPELKRQSSELHYSTTIKNNKLQNMPRVVKQISKGITISCLKTFHITFFIVNFFIVIT